jgi:hypothetical protein
VRAQYEPFRPSVVLIEDKASGTQLIQELIDEGLFAVTRYQPQTDKIMRMHAQTAMIENGFVHVPEAAPWLAQYLHELTVFPHGSTTTRSIRPRKCSTGTSEAAAPALTPGSSNFTGGAEEARWLQAVRERRVRLRVPQGIGRMNLVHLNVAADGTVEMLESEAESFLRAR